MIKQTIKQLPQTIVTYILDIFKIFFGGIKTILTQVSTDPIKLMFVVFLGAITTDIVFMGKLGTVDYVIDQVTQVIKALSTFNKESWPVLVLIAVLFGLKK